MASKTPTWIESGLPVDAQVAVLFLLMPPPGLGLAAFRELVQVLCSISHSQEGMFDADGN